MKLAEVMFNPKTYEGCKIIDDYMHPQRIRMEGVKGTDLGVTMTLTVGEDFDIVMRVEVERAGVRALFHEEKATDKHIAFWRQMRKLSYAYKEKSQDALLKQAQEILLR